MNSGVMSGVSYGSSIRVALLAKCSLKQNIGARCPTFAVRIIAAVTESMDVDTKAVDKVNESQATFAIGWFHTTNMHPRTPEYIHILFAR